MDRAQKAGKAHSLPSFRERKSSEEFKVGKGAKLPAFPTFPAQSLFEALATAARDCAAEIGLPVALEDDAVHAVLRAGGLNPNAAARQRLGMAAGLHTFPAGQWSYHAPDLRMFCTAPIDPRLQAAWDDILWLSPRNLLARANGKDAQ